jgi:hypothetical protein
MSLIDKRLTGEYFTGGIVHIYAEESCECVRAHLQRM